MLLESVVHESDAVPSEGVTRWDTLGLILEPFDLVSPDAVHSASTHAVVSTCAEEPNTSQDLVLIVGRADWNAVGELVVQALAIVLVRVILSNAIGVLLCLFHHCVLVCIRLEVMVARDEAKWDFILFQHRGQLRKVAPPEVWGSVLLIPGLPTHNVAGDCDEVWCLLPYHLFDLIHRLLIRFWVFTEMEVSQLHNLEPVALIELQIHISIVVNIVICEGKLGSGKEHCRKHCSRHY